MKTENINTMCKNIKNDSTLEKLLNTHHELYSSHPIGPQLEELFCKTFKNFGGDLVWKKNGHQPGMDLVFNGVDISVKSLSLIHKKKQNTSSIKISSHRTTKYHTLEEKYEFLKKSHEDCILGVVHSEKHTNNIITHKYDIVIIKRPPFEILLPKIWSKTFSSRNCTKHKHTGYKCNHDGINFTINSSMSDQLWLEYPSTHKDISYLKQIIVSQPI